MIARARPEMCPMFPQLSEKTKVEELYEELTHAGFVAGPMDTGELQPQRIPPFNVFARVATGKLDQKANKDVGWLGAEAENEKIGVYAENYKVACNL